MITDLPLLRYWRHSLCLFAFIAVAFFHHGHAVGEGLDFVVRQVDGQGFALGVDQAESSCFTVLYQLRLALDERANGGGARRVELLQFEGVDVFLLVSPLGGVEVVADHFNAGKKCGQRTADQTQVFAC